ncbi:MAG: PAS domain S-box protein [Abditibacteriales bacterium]|nr:PAS domain S-box protein [Abditibacteriales bacterium]MDW8366191.1 PAS domain S-box protein [Abditibacteriales bacterium]
MEEQLLNELTELRQRVAELEAREAERQQIEKALRESEQRLRGFFEATTEGVAIHSQGIILDCNPAFAAMFGYDLSELIGMNALQLAAPESRELVRQHILSGYEQPYEAVGLRRDGSTFIGEVCGKAILYQGRPARVTTIRDITEHRRQEEERLLLAAAIEQAFESIVITDTAGRIEYVNPAFVRLNGYTLQEVIGQNIRILKSGQHDAAFYRELWETIKRGEAWQGHFVNRRKDGSLYVQESVISPVRDASGAVVRYVAVSRDITREQILEAQLRQVQKMEAIGRLAGGIAHDFNNLLTAIIGYAELLMVNLPPESPLRAHAEGIFKAGGSAASLTRQLLAFSRQQVLQPEVLNLNDIVSHTTQFIERLIGEDIQVVTMLDPQLRLVEADPTQIEQVILNLAVNARDAMPQGGTLTLETKNVYLDEAYARLHFETQPGHYVLLAVSDSGVGMDEETQLHIFEPFFTTKEMGKGTGLGLSTVYGIVKQSGGRIEVYSEEGRGTTFKIYLPCLEGAAEAAAESVASPPLLPGQETILIVEDADAVRDSAREALSQSGYTVLEARNGEEALRLSQQHAGPIHLLLTDVMMPLMSGRELAEQLTAQRPETKVLYMSGYTDNAIVNHGVLAPGIAYLQKPFSPAVLTQKVREVLDTS